jgi:VanZ family protein
MPAYTVETIYRLLGATERRMARLPAGARWALALGWYGFVSLLSHAPGTDVESTQGLLELLRLGDLNTLFRIAAHVAVFGVQAVLLYLALNGDLRASARPAAAAIALTALLGAGDELHQHFVPLRHGRWQDAALDAVGGAVTLLLALGIARRAHRRLPGRPGL